MAEPKPQDAPYKRGAATLVMVAGLTYLVGLTLCIFYFQAACLYNNGLSGLLRAGVAPTSASMVAWPYFAWKGKLPEWAEPSADSDSRFAARPTSDTQQSAAVSIPADATSVDLADLVNEARMASEAGDAKRGAELFARACTGGSAFGCLGLGILELDGGPGLPANAGAGAKHVEQALPTLQSDCASRKFEVCLVLGALYVDGRAVPKDPAVARSLFEVACKRAPATYRETACLLARCVGGKTSEDGDACAMIAMASLGDGAVPAGIAKKGIAMFEAGCAIGSAMACSMLGIAYSTGQNVAKDAQKSALYLGKACKCGDTHACEMAKIFSQLGREPQYKP